ncbi:MAG: hypothetical protein J3K34DRAFT_256859 [Monoraphidium minutum]|nr:MAG: hypothetical protein J3K34DRAFT_256859 [Monoraphidium minutum]
MPCCSAPPAPACSGAAPAAPDGAAPDAASGALPPASSLCDLPDPLLEQVLRRAYGPHLGGLRAAAAVCARWRCAARGAAFEATLRAEGAAGARAAALLLRTLAAAPPAGGPLAPAAGARRGGGGQGACGPPALPRLRRLRVEAEGAPPAAVAELLRALSQVEAAAKGPPGIDLVSARRGSLRVAAAIAWRGRRSASGAPGPPHAVPQRSTPRRGRAPQKIFIDTCGASNGSGSATGAQAALAPLAALRRVASLSLAGCGAGLDAALASSLAPALASLSLSPVRSGGDLAPLARLTALRALSLALDAPGAGGGWAAPLLPLARALESLEVTCATYHLRGAGLQGALQVISQLPRLTRLTLAGAELVAPCPEGWPLNADLRPLTGSCNTSK